MGYPPATLGAEGWTVPPISADRGKARNASGLRTVLFGHSFIDRHFTNTAVETSYNNYGAVNVVNMLLGNPFNIVYNGGVIGDTTTQMLARIRTALAYDPRVVFIDAGTNDTGTAASIISNLTSIFEQFLAIGAEVIYNTITPRSSYSGSISAANALRVNEWAMTYARNKPGLTVIPVHDADGLLNPASTSYAIASGNAETASSVHLNSAAIFNTGTFMANVLRGKYHAARRLISSMADCIAVDSNSNQLFQYGVLNDTGSPAGTKTNTGGGTAPTGTVADGLDVDHTVNTTGTCVCSVAARTVANDGDTIGKNLVLTLGGGVTMGANDKILVRSQGNMTTAVAGGTYQAECDIRVASPVKITSIAMWVQAAVDSGSALAYYAMRHNADPVDMPSNFVGGHYRTPEFTLPSGTTVTTFHLRCEIRFTTAGGSGVVNIGRWSCRRIVD